jgi:hypothetical protein
MQMIKNAGLAFSDGFSSFVLAHMLAMAGEKDSRIGIQETSDPRVHHRREIVTNGLMYQTKCFVSLCRGLQLRQSLSAKRRDCARVTSHPEVEPRPCHPLIGLASVSKDFGGMCPRCRILVQVKANRFVNTRRLVGTNPAQSSRFESLSVCRPHARIAFRTNRFGTKLRRKGDPNDDNRRSDRYAI